MKKRILVLGGAGFIGSQISKLFVEKGYEVIIVDGLLKNTGGLKKNLHKIIKKVKFYDTKIENKNDLSNLVKYSDLIIDCMGWTSHTSALKYPMYDLQLNVLSHLTLIRALKNNPSKNIIFLGSRVQYGNPGIKLITEKTSMEPLDIQGIHKLTAENYFRIFSKLQDLNVTSLRIGNCFGPNQKINSNDIGLVGNFIKSSLEGKNIDLYETKRFRTLVYVQDIANIVFRLSQNLTPGFNAYNLVGQEIYLTVLIKKIINITGSGTYKIVKMPLEIKKIDIGNAKISETKLRKKLGNIPKTNFDTALRETIKYFKENL